MPKELSEKEKLGVEILKDLKKLEDIIPVDRTPTGQITINLISGIATKVKNLTLKF